MQGLEERQNRKFEIIKRFSQVKKTPTLSGKRNYNAINPANFIKVENCFLNPHFGKVQW